MGDWVVVLEFSASRDYGPFDLAVVQALVERLREWHPSGLYDPDRYAIQLHVAADGAESMHEQALQAVGVMASFTRAEVLTLGEFEATWGDEEVGATHLPRPAAAEALISVEVYEATRSLLSATSAAAVIDVLVRFVLAVGGRVNVGQQQQVPGMVSVDISTSPREQLHAVAERFSVAGLIIERWLPSLLDDAKRTLALLEGSP
jgi:hypothetical protein